MGEAWRLGKACYSCCSCPNLLDNAKHRVVSALVLDVLQKFAFSVSCECVEREERERGREKASWCETEGESVF